MASYGSKTGLGVFHGNGKKADEGRFPSKGCLVRGGRVRSTTASRCCGVRLIAALLARLTPSAPVVVVPPAILFAVLGGPQRRVRRL